MKPTFVFNEKISVLSYDNLDRETETVYKYSPSFRTISPYEAFSSSIFESMAEAIGKGEF